MSAEAASGHPRSGRAMKAPLPTIEISPLSLMQLAGVSLVIATISSIVPIWQIVGLEPALIVRGGK